MEPDLNLMQRMMCSVGLHKDEELSAFKERMAGAGLRTIDLTNNDLAKDHLRHLVDSPSVPVAEIQNRDVFQISQGKCEWVNNGSYLLAELAHMSAGILVCVCVSYNKSGFSRLSRAKWKCRWEVVHTWSMSFCIGLCFRNGLVRL